MVRYLRIRWHKWRAKVAHLHFLRALADVSCGTHLALQMDIGGRYRRVRDSHMEKLKMLGNHDSI